MYIAPNAFDPAESLKSTSAIEDEVVRLTDGLSQGQFHAPTRTGGWSIGYCVEHLILTGHGLLSNWDKALHTAAVPASGAGSGFRYRWYQRALLQCVQKPSILKCQTVPALVPCSRHSMEETLKSFLAMHHGLALRLEASLSLDLRRTKVTIPSVPAVRCSLGFAFDLLLAHECRHLSQAWRVRRQISEA